MNEFLMMPCVVFLCCFDLVFCLGFCLVMFPFSFYQNKIMTSRVSKVFDKMSI